MDIDSSIYFCCDALPDESPMLRGDWLEARECGGYISPSYKSPIKPDAPLHFHEWEKFLRRNRELLKQCDTPALDIGIMADCQVADFDLTVPPRVLQAFAQAGVWLQITFMVNGNERVRYQKKYYKLLSADIPTGKTIQGLPPSILQHQSAIGLYPVSCNSSLYAPDDFPTEASTIAICQYPGEWGFCHNHVPPPLMAELCARSAQLRLHINMPQRRGRKLNCTLG